MSQLSQAMFGYSPVFLVLQNTKNKLNHKCFSNSLCLNVWYILTTTKKVSVTNQELLIFRNESDYIKLILRPPKEAVLKADIHQQLLIIWLCVQYMRVFYISYIYWDKYAFSFSPRNHTFIYTRVCNIRGHFHYVLHSGCWLWCGMQEWMLDRCKYVRVQAWGTWN